MRDILVGTTLGWLVGAAWWFGVALPRRKKYEEFYRNYDAKAVAAATKASFEEGGHYLEHPYHFSASVSVSISPLQTEVYRHQCHSDRQFVIISLL